MHQFSDDVFVDTGENGLLQKRIPPLTLHHQLYRIDGFFLHLSASTIKAPNATWKFLSNQSMCKVPFSILFKDTPRKMTTCYWATG